MTVDQKLKDRVNELIQLGEKVSNMIVKNDGMFGNLVDIGAFREFESASLSFILKIYSKEHPFYETFARKVNHNYSSDVQQGIAILKSIKSEIDGGWLSSFRELISGEIFSDFLEMAEYLLKENYKDPSAVIIGSVLEEHVRTLCVKNSITIEDNIGGKIKPKKAESMNSELYTNQVYGKGDNKQITAWLDIRNSAAHGKYTEYSKEQVDLMLAGVQNFILRNP